MRVKWLHKTKARERQLLIHDSTLHPVEHIHGFINSSAFSCFFFVVLCFVLGITTFITGSMLRVNP